MEITKYVHACLLVKTDTSVALFDPGVMSKQALPVDTIDRLDAIIITHGHPDHYDLELMQALVQKFPDVHITAPTEVVTALASAGITAHDQPSDGIVLFDAPHEPVAPLFPLPQEIGVHWRGVLTHPGDSHSFHETKAVLALPITGPWGSSVRALNLALELKPQHVVPIHDWHWQDAARAQTYDRFAEVLGEQGITFYKPETGQPLQIPVDPA